MLIATSAEFASWKARFSSLANQIYRKYPGGCGWYALGSKRPIANAAWKELNQQPGMYQSYAKEYTDRFRVMGLRLSDLGFSDSDANAWGELALRFTLSQPGVHTAISDGGLPVLYNAARTVKKFSVVQAYQMVSVK